MTAPRPCGRRRAWGAGPRPRLVGAALLVTLGLLPWIPDGSAQPPGQQTAPGAQPSPGNQRALEPAAIDLLKASSHRLAAARSMSFTAVASYESPSLLGPPLVYTTRSEVTLKRPDKLRVITPADGPASEFYYDGKAMMAFAPGENLVAVAEAPPTIDAALEVAYRSAAIYFPFTDAIVSDPYGAIAEKLEIAFYIGTSRVVGGTTTHMVAYASEGVFVQMWIGTADLLPRRARAIYRDDPLRLRHQVDFANWKLDAPVAAAAFTSPRASRAKRIPFARPDPQPPPEGKAPASGEPPKPR